MGDGFYPHSPPHSRRPEETLRKMDPTNVLGKPKERKINGGRREVVCKGGVGAPGWNEDENENDSGKRRDKAK